MYMNAKVTTVLGAQFVALCEAFPLESMTEGRVIEYSTFEGVTKLKRDSVQFKAVLNRWRRKLLKEHLIKLVAIPKVGLQVADNSRRLQEANKSNDRALRHAQQATVLLKTVDVTKLDERERLVYDCNTRLNSGLLLAGSKEKIVPRLL
ncbi:MAG: hypothetical protein IJF84_13670 [Thermoguttaceae bacterium]|nr:hypothetical protein [Thermoguttaceae bacterium]